MGAERALSSAVPSPRGRREAALIAPQRLCSVPITSWLAARRLGVPAALPSDAGGRSACSLLIGQLALR